MNANTKYVFRYDNHEYTDAETYGRFILWCGMYEIPVKYIGKSKKGRCRWLQIEVTAFLAAIIKANMKHLQLYRTIGE